MERILNKKITTLNELKAKLVLRSDESKEVLVQRIKDTVDDIDLILKDSKYIKDEESSSEEVDIEMFVKRGGYRCDSQFTLDDLNEFNNKDLFYISVDGTVYDVTESRFWREKLSGTEVSERIFSTANLENPESLNEGKVVGTLVD